MAAESWYTCLTACSIASLTAQIVPGLSLSLCAARQFFHGMELLQVYKQKVKHLLYEHQEDNAALRIEAEQQQKQASDEAERRVQELVTDKQNLQRELNEQACWPFPNLLSTQRDDGLSKCILLNYVVFYVSMSRQSSISMDGAC